MTKLGFTGTREGMTGAQKAELHARLNQGDVDHFHHGDCVGSDAQAHEMVMDIGTSLVIVHPPDKDDLRAHCEGDIICDPKPYLERDRAIVDACDELFATPRDNNRQMGGTWYTVNYARTNNKTVTVVYPDGKVVVWEAWENEPIPSD